MDNTAVTSGAHGVIAPVKGIEPSSPDRQSGRLTRVVHGQVAGTGRREAGAPSRGIEPLSPP